MWGTGCSVYTSEKISYERQVFRKIKLEEGTIDQLITQLKMQARNC